MILQCFARTKCVSLAPSWVNSGIPIAGGMKAESMFQIEVDGTDDLVDVHFQVILHVSISNRGPKVGNLGPLRF